MRLLKGVVNASITHMRKIKSAHSVVHTCFILEINVFSILKARAALYTPPAFYLCVLHIRWWYGISSFFFGVAPRANFDTKNIHFRNYDKVITQNTNFFTAPLTEHHHHHEMH